MFFFVSQSIFVFVMSREYSIIRFNGKNYLSWEFQFKMFVKSKKQDRVSKSSMESEYRAMSLASEIIWL